MDLASSAFPCRESIQRDRAVGPFKLATLLAARGPGRSIYHVRRACTTQVGLDQSTVLPTAEQLREFG